MKNKILIGILIIIILIMAIGGFKGYRESQIIKELMPISKGGLGMCEKICIEDGYKNGCFIPSIPECNCDGVEIEDYSYCEERN